MSVSKQSCGSILRAFSQNTVMHGIGNVGRDDNRSVIRRNLHRLLWAAFFLVVLVNLGYQIYKIGDKYLQYPVAVSVDVIFNRRADFPAVTICNLNPVRRHQLSALQYRDEPTVVELDDLVRQMRENSSLSPYGVVPPPGPPPHGGRPPPPPGPHGGGMGPPPGPNQGGGMGPPGPNQGGGGLPPPGPPQPGGGGGGGGQGPPPGPNQGGGGGGFGPGGGGSSGPSGPNQGGGGQGPPPGPNQGGGGGGFGPGGGGQGPPSGPNHGGGGGGFGPGGGGSPGPNQGGGGGGGRGPPGPAPGGGGASRPPGPNQGGDGGGRGPPQPGGGSGGQPNPRPGPSGGFDDINSAPKTATTPKSGRVERSAPLNKQEATDHHPFLVKSGLQKSLNNPPAQESSESNSTDDDDELAWWDKLEKQEDVYDSQFLSVQSYRQFLQTLAEVPPNIQSKIGHQKTAMILTCSFGGKICTPRNFTRTWNYKYGNCYTFNSGWLKDLQPPNMSQPVVGVTQPGPLHGLALDLFVETGDYVKEISPSVGLRLVLHSQERHPFPEDEGFDLTPGFATSFGVRMVTIERKPAPYFSKCVHNESQERNAFASETVRVGYSMQACMKTCIQKRFITKCGCASIEYPSQSDIFSKLRTPAGDTWLAQKRVCDQDNFTDVACSRKLLKEITENATTICDCPLNCKDILFNTAVSQSSWPSRDYAGTLIDSLKTRSKYWTDKINSYRPEEQSTRALDDFSRNLLKLQIYYEDLNYELIKQTPSYEMEDAMSALGGQVGTMLFNYHVPISHGPFAVAVLENLLAFDGQSKPYQISALKMMSLTPLRLWVGLSVIAIVELVELIFDLVWYLLGCHTRAAVEAEETKAKQTAAASRRQRPHPLIPLSATATLAAGATPFYPQMYQGLVQPR